MQKTKKNNNFVHRNAKLRHDKGEKSKVTKRLRAGKKREAEREAKTRFTLLFSKFYFSVPKLSQVESKNYFKREKEAKN